MTRQNASAAASSCAQSAYSPSTNPPQALKRQLMPRASVPLVTNVGPMSRAQASSVPVSSIVANSPACARASSICAAPARRNTRSLLAASRIMLQNARCAACGFLPQLPGRTGQTSSTPSCGANSAGIANPSCAGSVYNMLGKPSFEIFVFGEQRLQNVRTISL